MLSSSTLRLSHVGNVVGGIGNILSSISPFSSPFTPSTPPPSSSPSSFFSVSPQEESPKAEKPPSSTVSSIAKPFYASSRELPQGLVEDLTRANSQSQSGMLREGANRPKPLPATRTSRAAGFTSLLAKIAWDKAVGTTPEGGLLSLRSHQNIVETLCRMRGAVLKLGQMLSIQDEEMVPAHITALFARVRDQALSIPTKQLVKVLNVEFKDKNWQEKLFLDFEETPIAAASIGQVHRARIKLKALSDEEQRRCSVVAKKAIEGEGELKSAEAEEDSVEVAVKVQYPGVAQSIDSDIANLKLLMRLNIFPSGLFMDKVLRDMRDELRMECQYTLEGAKQNKYYGLINADPSLSDFFSVPYVFQSLSTDNVMISEFIPGISVDKLTKRDDIPQDFRNFLAEKMLLLTLKELFCWSFMQTDPNYANFIYDAEANRMHLLDFGAAREYPLEFTEDYLEVVAAAARMDREGIIKKSTKLGFLSGREVPEMVDAHVSSVMLLGKPFRDPMNPYDFTSENLPSQISKYLPIMLKHRLRPPPMLSYSLHRRLSGIILLASKLNATAACGEIFWKIYEDAREIMMEKKREQAALSST
ncbi:unnamed protein product [Phytomonas sp. Hart1]|nr:unnamed protein product [Phytomonas sp. Hart1]|eukprot:CCW69884.1 unnamed protein product [Phytomonas sp. isolate Hart1]